VLDLSSCWEITDATAVAMGSLCPRLHCIDLSNCKKLQDSGLIELATALPGLRELKLAYCKAISDLSLQHLLERCQHLRALNLQRCTGISDASWRTLQVPQHQLPELVALVLADCSFLTDDAVASISIGCPHLKYLNLSFCCALSSAAVESIIAGCTEVRRRAPNGHVPRAHSHVSARGATVPPGNFLRAQLESLDLSFCGSAVNDDMLRLLAEGLPKLRKLSVRYASIAWHGSRAARSHGLANIRKPAAV